MEENTSTNNTLTVNDITIENMLQDIFLTTTIKKKRKDIVAYYSRKFGNDLFGDNANETGQRVSEQDIAQRVDAVLKEDKNSIDPFLKYTSPYYSKRPKKSKSIDSIGSVDTNYMGKAGECAVMGELLFRGYNVNNMMVDEGIDLVASKNNVFYYIQVKTKSVDVKNRFYFQISQERFDTFIGTQIRYFLVARCKFNNEERNMFFMFANNDIMRLRQRLVIPQPSADNGNLSLKIEYDTRTGKAFMYDGKCKEDVSFYMNNFNL